MSDSFPPPNPAIRWFRVVVWMMPTCVAFTTWIGLNLLAPMLGEPNGYWLFGWGVMNLLSTFALGVLDGKLRRSMHPPDDVFTPEAQFLVLQIMIVPSLFLAGFLMISVILSVT